MNSKPQTDDLDYDFRHHLRNTIVLLGGKVEIADLLLRSIDLAVTQDDVSLLRAYNAELITLAKDRLAKISTVKIFPRADR